MAVGGNHGVYDYIRTDDQDHPGAIITRNDEYVGIRTRRHSPYGTETTRESDRSKFGGSLPIFTHPHSRSLSHSRLLPLSLLRLGIGFPEVFLGVAGEDST